MCLGSVQSRTSVRLGLTSQQLVLQAHFRIRLTLCHIERHGGTLGSECTDHAATLGVLVFVSSHNVNSRWSHPSFNASIFVRECNDLVEIQHRLRDARGEHTPSQQARAVLELWSAPCLIVASLRPRSHFYGASVVHMASRPERAFASTSSQSFRPLCDWP